jgi:integrase
MNNDFYLNAINNASIALATKTKHNTSIKKMLKVLQIDNIHDLIYDSKYSTLIETKINNNNSLYTLCNTILAISKYTNIDKNLIIHWKNLFDKIKNTINNRILTNVPDQKAINTAHLNWENILDIVNTLDYSINKNVLIAMYTLIPPRRQTDYHLLKVYNDNLSHELTHNHINLNPSNNKPYLFITDSKNTKTMGNYFTHDLPIKLIEIIKNSLIQTPREYLLCNKFGKPFASISDFTKANNSHLKNVFKSSDFSVNTFRHKFATWFNTQNNITLLERKNISNAMGHTIIENMKYSHHNIDEIKAVAVHKF